MSLDSNPADFTPPAVEEIADLLPAYEVLSFIAKGGMGAVYLARQKSLDREVAIKILPRHYGEDADFRASFETEAKSMAKFNHPNLIGIYDFGQVDGLLYIIMEMVKGKSLYHSAYGKTIDPDEAARIVSGICKGLTSAHSHGILHRDIKPANILLDPQASPKIGDFGLARPVGDHENDSAFGTPGYTAPEVVNNPSAVDESTDIYAVGVILYELLTGKLPESIYTPASTIAGCDPRFDQIIRKATHPTPAMRYRAAEEIANALEDIRQNKKPTNPLLTKANSGSENITSGKTLAVTESAQKRPALNTDESSDSKNPSSSPSSTPAVQVGSNAPFIRNIIIIIGLLAAIFIAWEGLKVVRANRAAENAEVEKLAAQKKKDKEAEDAAKKAAALNDPSRVVRKKRPVKELNLPPKKIETPRETLTRLRSQLARGLRSEMPKGSFTRSGRARMYIGEQMTWSQAQTFCEKHGGYLTVLPEATDLQWLCSKLKSDQTIWLGAGSAGNKQWRWIDGTPWKQEIRNTSKASYVAVNDTAILEPQPASTLHSFFIEWNMDGSNPASLENQLKRCAESLTSTQPEFPAGTISYDNRHYLLVQSKTDWETARSLAETGKGNLAIPSNPDENIWIVGFLATAIDQKQACWIGGFKPSDGAWKWTTGEPWKFAQWAEGAPNEDSGTAVGCAVQPSKKWEDYPIDSKLSHFLIEWSKDGQGLKAIKSTGVANDQLTPMRRKCADLINDIKKRYEKEYTNNIKGYEQELRVYKRGLSQQIAEAMTPGLIIMTSRYPDNRIPDNIPRANMPTKVTDILDSRLDKQTRLTTKYLAEIQTLSEKYRASLQKLAQELTSKGLNSRLSLVKKELSNTSGQPKAFEQHILNGG